MRPGSSSGVGDEAGGEKQGQGVNESQQESRLNDGKNLISKIHKSAGSQQADKKTTSESTFPQLQGPPGGQQEQQFRSSESEHKRGQKKKHLLEAGCNGLSTEGGEHFPIRMFTIAFGSAEKSLLCYNIQQNEK